MAERRDWLGRAIDWERLRTPENDWERLGSAPTRRRDYETTGRRDCGTAGLRDNETTRRRDDETARQRDDGTTGRRDYETAGRRDGGTTRRRDDETTGRRDCETTGRRDHGTTGPRDHGTTGRRDNETAEKHRHSQAFSGILSCARQCVAAWRQSGADVFYRKRECRGIVLKRTAHGTLLFGIGRRCAAITSSYDKPLLVELRPRIFKRYRAVEDKVVRRRVGVGAEVANTLKLIGLAHRGILQRRL